ncbi:Nonribosomal peptide synthetase dtxS1 [Penicillium antarcticum]|uniref:Nonribosomal peptide synthetase dtxS1 n=1 Tax=Penicillium antarcticum TaxID=416450 RepID=UPI00238DDFCC|nr:Nonribosomal peptide synthetase dtxS1 [Penicillium antarcticum]KAJ5312432.1 Nonribosomal peptide synthetase dtxS1 [Penicillium antarcticum]
MEKVWRVGTTVPETIHDHVHKCVAQTVLKQPQSPAVCAWDGELSYAELDRLARKLAGQLVVLGVQPGEIVPLLFEKSLWTAVAVLGVVKAGAGFVILDRFLPESRLQSIVKLSEPKYILTSVSNRDQAERLSPGAPVVVGPSLGADDDGPFLPNDHPAPHPSSIVYVVFTSGSTGNPKGCMVSHENLCSALHHQIPCLGYTPESRVFDFASYSFDITIHNMFATWWTGGCVCIPSDVDRTENLAKTMTRMQASLVHLTPTVARLLDPESVLTLDTLILLGEMITDHDIKPWWGRVKRLINAYGPTECTSYSALNYQASSPTMLASIGIGKGSVVWVVDSEDHHILLPWGQPGELLIEGPIVGLGYLNDPEKTEATFIEDPRWLIEGGCGVPGRHGRLYKTGDLGMYSEDGSIVILGRKDTQVKIRGNRIELGEVECEVQDCMPEVSRVVAEAIRPQQSKSHILAVFLCMPGSTSGPDAEMINVSKETVARLAQKVPMYMLPSLFFSMAELPLTLTGKLDRRRLREIGSSWSMEKVVLAASSDKRPPRTREEDELRSLWAHIFNIDQCLIGIDDDFFHLGGDSMSALQLVGAARKVGSLLTLASIFQNPILSAMSKAATRALSIDIPLTHNSLGLTFIDEDMRDDLTAHIATSIGLKDSDVAEVLPLTDMQEYYIRDGMTENRQFVDYYYLDLGPDVDIPRLKSSCRQIMELFPIITATFVLYQGQHFAVTPKILQLPFGIIDVTQDLPDATATLCLEDISIFERYQTIVRFTLVRHQSQGMRLILRLSHAQYDAVSIGLIFKAMGEFYRSSTPAKRPTFSHYIAHISQRRPSSISYFKRVLGDVCFTEMSTQFLPMNPPTTAVPYRLQNEILTPRTHPGITLASVMSAAWAIFLSKLLNCNDIVFGRLINGRNAPLPGIEELVGCCINVSPARVSLKSPKMTVKDLIQDVQNQFAALGDADALGFEEAVRECTTWPAGKGIYTATMHQNVEEDLPFEFEDGFTGHLRRFENDRRLPFFLYMISYPRGDKMGVEIFSHTRMVCEEKARLLLDRFCPVVEQVAEALREGMCIEDIEIECNW